MHPTIDRKTQRTESVSLHTLTDDNNQSLTPLRDNHTQHKHHTTIHSDAPAQISNTAHARQRTGVKDGQGGEPDHGADEKAGEDARHDFEDDDGGDETEGDDYDWCF